MQNFKNTIVEFFKYSASERMARNLVRSYFNNDPIAFRKESNGTVRFITERHVQGFYRVRKNKFREISGQHDNSFRQVHIGKLTIAIESPVGRDLWNFSLTASK